MATQNQSIRANLVKAKIVKSQGDSLCRVCRKVDESIDHVVSGCSKLAQKSTSEGMIIWEKYYIGSLLESVILKLWRNDMNISQKVF